MVRIEFEAYEAAAIKGTGFVASTDQLTLGVAGNLRITFENPTGDTDAVIKAIVTAKSASGVSFADVRLAPTTGLPSAVKPIRNLIIDGGSASSGMVLKADTSTTTPLGGGTHLFDIPVVQDRTVYREAIFRLKPGNTVGINLPFAGSGSGQFLAYFWEESA